MKGTLTITAFSGGGLVEDDNPLRGKWQYDDGILVRGLIKKQTFNLASKIKAIRIMHDNWKKIVVDDIANNSFMKAGIMAGGNTIAGLAAVSIKKKSILRSEIFDVFLKDGTQFVCITDKLVFREIMSFDGVEILKQEL